MRHLRRPFRTRLALPSLAAGVALVLGGTPLLAQTVNDFEGGGTPVTLEAFGTGPGPAIVTTGGNPDSALEVTQAANSSHNWATFDVTDDPGAGFDGFGTATFSFDYQVNMGTVPTADGFSFSLVDTARYGETGGVAAAPFTAEDPVGYGILGFGFDTWSNSTNNFDQPGIGDGTDYNDISVFWNRDLIQRTWDRRNTPTLDPPLAIDDGEWHSVEGSVNFDAQTVSLSVDGNPIATDLMVPGLEPFKGRVMLAGRTGGENEQVLIDNVNVEWATPSNRPAPVGEQPAPTAGMWSIREWRPAYNVDGVAGADAVIADPTVQTRRYVRDGMAETINHFDPTPGAGGGGFSIPNVGRLAKQPFVSDTEGPDDDIVMRARSTIVVPEDGEYTFGIDGDDGTRLQVTGANFTYQGGAMGGEASGEILQFPANTGNAFSLGSTFLAAGEYDVELTWQERGGGAFVEVFAAPGVYNADSGTTQGDLASAGFAPLGMKEELVIAQGTLPTIVGEWQVKNVDVIGTIPSSAGVDATGLNNLADAQAAIDLLEDDPNFYIEFSDEGPADVINFRDPESPTADAGRFVGPNNVDDFFPIDAFGTDDNDFALEATATVSIPEEGDYIFGFGSDDGAALTLTGADFTILGTTNADVAEVTNDGQTIEFNVNTGNSDTFATTHLMPGEYELTYLMWERGGGAWAEVYTGVGGEPESILSARLLGSPEETFDLVITPVIQLAGSGGPDPLQGDYSGNGLVEQADLDLVLGNWGQSADNLPATWVNDPATGFVDQNELDKVLSNWGASAGLGGAAGVPEPSSIALVLVVAGLGLGARFARKR